MTGPSKGKARSSSNAQRFTDYLNGLRKEFQHHANPTLATSSPGSSRFDIFLGGLKCEFELMALEIESLTKERDKFEAVGTYFVFFLPLKCFNQLLSSKPRRSRRNCATSLMNDPSKPPELPPHLFQLGRSVKNSPQAKRIDSRCQTTSASTPKNSICDS